MAWEGTATIGGKRFRHFIESDALSAAVGRMAEQITADYASEPPLVLCMLNGAFVFAAYLLRAIAMPMQVQFVRYASYEGLGSTGQVNRVMGLSIPVAGRSVLIVEDIVDSGRTMQHFLQELRDEGASQIRIATMFLKPEAFQGGFDVQYVGLEIPNRFVVGYGLDFDGLGRNLPHLYILDE